MRRWSLCLLLAFQTACGGDAPPLDGGSRDAGGLDAGSLDAGSSDAGSSDAGSSDAGLADSGFEDAGLQDAGLDDAGVFSDAGSSLPGPVQCRDDGDCGGASGSCNRAAPGGVCNGQSARGTPCTRKGAGEASEAARPRP